MGIKKGDKFVIEVEKEDIDELGYCKIKGFNSYVDHTNLSQLEKYDGAKEREAYTKALNDVEEAIRKLYFCERLGGLSVSEIREIFGIDECADILLGFPLSEIVEKLQRYEEEQSEIRVGDEVEINDSEVVVTYVRGNKMFVLYGDGSTEEIVINRTEIRKTGRHFGEIESLLKILKGGDDSDKISF